MPFASPELRTRRKAAGVKASPFAKRVDCSRSHLLNVEARRKPGSDELFARAARELGCTVADLIGTNPGAPSTSAKQQPIHIRRSASTADAA